MLKIKMSIISTLLIAEMTAYYNSIGLSIPKELKKLHEKFGYYREGIITITQKGKTEIEANEKLIKTMKKFEIFLDNQ